MNGHELVRTAILDLLRAQVPGRLAVLRAARSLSPADAPDPVVYALDERWPSKDTWPAVCVPSTELRSLIREANDAGAETWTGTYAVNVAVGTRFDEHRATNEAALQRDRLLLAVREVLLLSPKPQAGVRIMPNSIAEEAGTPGEDIAARPHALGVVSFTVQTEETIAPAADPPTADTADVEVAPVVQAHAAVT